jgi:hypothetical protein
MLPDSVRLSDAERDGAAVAPGSLARARETFDQRGAVIVENLLPVPFVDALAAAWVERHGGVGAGDSGDLRVMHPVRIAAPFDAPALYAHPFVMALVGALMEHDHFVLNSCSAVTARPGAPAEPLHRVHELLFGARETSLAIPTYALTLGIPLVDLTAETGTTSMCEGTHRSLERPADIAPERLRHPHIPRGAAWLMDYRLVRGDSPNRGDRPRPILELVYTRRWWIDAANFAARGVPPLLVDERTLGRVPPHLALLFERARTRGTGSDRIP